MNKEIFRERYRKFDITENEIEKCILTITDMEEFLDKDLDEVTIDDIKKYFIKLVQLFKEQDLIEDNYKIISKNIFEGFVIYKKLSV